MLLVRKVVLVICLTVCGYLSILSSTHAFVNIEDISKETGYSTWFAKVPENEIVAVGIAFRHSGSAFDPPERQGLALVAAYILRSGPEGTEKEEFQRWLRDRGVRSFSMGVSRNIFQIEFQVPSKNLAVVLEKIAEILLKPPLTKKNLQEARLSYPSNVFIDQSSSTSFGIRQLNSKIFSGHPYEKDPQGTVEGVQSLSLEDIRAYIKNNLTVDRLMVTVVGDLTKEVLVSSLKKGLDRLPANGKSVLPLPSVVQSSAISGDQVTVFKKDIPQSVIFFALPAVELKEEDRFPAYIADHILGGGTFTSRLWVKIRDQEGLAYMVDTEIFTMPAGEVIRGRCHTGNKTAYKAIQLIGKVWRTFYEKGVTEQELERAKNYLIGSFPLGLTTTLDMVGSIAYLQHLNFSPDYLKRRKKLLEDVTLEKINAVIHTYFNPQNLIFVVVGNQEDEEKENTPGTPMERGESAEDKRGKGESS